MIAKNEFAGFLLSLQNKAFFLLGFSFVEIDDSQESLLIIFLRMNFKERFTADITSLFVYVYRLLEFIIRIENELVDNLNGKDKAIR